MRMIFLLAALLALPGCGSRNPNQSPVAPIVLPEPPVATPVPTKFDTAWDSAKELVPDVPIWLREIITVLYIPADAVNPRTGNYGFYLDRASPPAEVMSSVMAVYAGSTDSGGRVLVQGYTDVFMPGKVTVWVVEGANAALLKHEFVHAMYWAAHPGEFCHGTATNVWAIVQHGIMCDPFQGRQ